ncbi:MAG: 4Fe-4S binding protein [Candidatus Omnitrophota bacterium]|nr:4Fe-4S binding protein [Candidatus Omnitrophota bacterium]
MKKLVILRRISQAAFLTLFIYILWSTTYPLKAAVSPSAFFRIDPLVIITTSVSERVLLPGLAASFAMLVLTLVFGRFFCGWVCPLGAAIDIAGARESLKKPENDKANTVVRKPKFFILGIIGFFAAAGLQLAWILDPIVIMARFVSLNLIPTVTLTLNSLFVILIRNLGMHGYVQDLYRSLKGTVLGIKVYYFSHSALIFLFFIVICALALLKRRLWCRSVCPLGALYALFARFALLGRTVKGCVECGICRADCRMGAIKEDTSYVKGECILCMDCVYNCPKHITRFGFSGPGGAEDPKPQDNAPGSGISRRQFMALALSSVFLTGFRFGKRLRPSYSNVIRPPAALKEEEFLDRCIRCGNCMKVCITNGLQPVLLKAGVEGIWTPELVPEMGYCEYQCTLCGNTCPTGAIPPLTVEKKRLVRLGTAEIDRSICIPWAEGKECIVCEEFCPVAQKAIKLKKEPSGASVVSKPYVSEDLCVGCGICQAKCPVRPARAIRVSPRNSDRT